MATVHVLVKISRWGLLHAKLIGLAMRFGLIPDGPEDLERHALELARRHGYYRAINVRTGRGAWKRIHSRSGTNGRA
jgi:hypothetical protein